MKFRDYQEIPPLLADYIANVAEISDIRDLPVYDINAFLSELEEFYNE